MPVDFTQVGNASIRVELDGVALTGSHAQLHTALSRAAKVAAENPASSVEVVREQRIRVESDVATEPQQVVYDGGSASSVFT